MELAQTSHISDGALQHYLRGVLPEGHARAIEQHYMTCRSCSDRMVLLEWFPEARPISTPAAPVVTISCRLLPERADAPVLQRALLSARMGYEMLAASDQIFGVTAVAAMAVLVLTASLSVLPNRQAEPSPAAPVVAEDVFDGSIATKSALQPQDYAVEIDRDTGDEPGSAMARRRPHRPKPNRLYARVFVPPEYTPPSWRLGASEPVLHAATPDITFQVSAPHLPFTPPKIDPPRSSRIKSVLKILSWPFRSERRDNRPARTIS
jgi:hypothetical protein